MNKTALKIYIVIFTFLFPLPLIAEPVSCSLVKSGDFSGAIQKSRKLVQDYMEEKQVVGLSIAISICDQLIWSEGFGYADLENNVPVTTETKFRIGSVSKTLTATALAQLHEKGLLELDRKIHDYVPDFPMKKHPVTTRQLASHLSGIRHYKGKEFLIAKYYPTVTEGLEIFQNDPLLHKPGSKFLYSSHAWNLLSAIIEKAANQNFLDYMQDQIFTPLQMKNTSADLNQKVITNRTRFYNVDSKGDITNAPYVDNSYKWAGGGFLANAEDLNIFGNAILYHRLISKPTFDLFTQSQETDAGISTQYGMGWSNRLLERNLTSVKKNYNTETADRILALLEDQGLVGHSGGSIGGKTLFWILPKSQMSVTAYSNSNISPAVALNATAEFVSHLKKNF